MFYRIVVELFTNTDPVNLKEEELNQIYILSDELKKEFKMVFSLYSHDIIHPGPDGIIKILDQLKLKTTLSFFNAIENR